MAPSAAVDGDVHVYCVEEDQVAITPCITSMDVTTRPARVTLRSWWLRAARVLRRAGTFTYKGAQWSFSEFDLTEVSLDGNRVSVFGWRCPSDKYRTGRKLQLAIDARDPVRPRGIHSLAAARRRGCEFGSYTVPAHSSG
jgi:hypothetical protein